MNIRDGVVGMKVAGVLDAVGGAVTAHATGAAISGTATFLGTSFASNDLGFDLSGRLTLDAVSVDGGQAGARLTGGTLTGDQFNAQTQRGVEIVGTLDSTVIGSTFDSAQGDLALDYSTLGPDFTGTLQNGVSVGYPGAMEGSGSATFDGVDDVVTLPGQPGLEAAPFAWAAWVFADPSLVNDAIVLDYHESGFFSGLSLRFLNGNLRWEAASSVFGPNPVAQAPLPLNAWVHVVASYDGDSIDLFLNGAPVANAPYASPIRTVPATSLIEIGGNATSGFGGPFSGRIDEVALFDRALTPADAAALFAARPGVPGGNDLTLTMNGRFIATSVADDGFFSWNIPPDMATGPATLRLESTPSSGVSDPFLIVDGGNRYYINDDAVLPGDLTLVVGNDDNAGKSSEAPMRNLAELMRLHDLEPGDIVHIDSGTYTLSDDLVIGILDSGVTIRSSAFPAGPAVFDRANRGPGTAAFVIQGAGQVTLENLSITGAEIGVRVVASPGFTLRESLLFENAVGGLRSDAIAGSVTVVNNIFRGVSGDETRDRDTHFELRGAAIVATGNTVFREGALVSGPGRNGDIGILVEASAAIAVTDNTVYNLSEGFVLFTVSGREVGGVISGNLSRDNGEGFELYSGGGLYLQVFGNTARDNRYTGFQAGGWLELHGNTSTENDIGFAMSAGVSHSRVRVGVDDARGGNIAALNRVGIIARDAFVYRNVVYGNTGDGLLLTGATDAVVVGNRVYSNGNFGIGSEGEAYAAVVENNLVYDNGNGGIAFGNGGFNFNRLVRNNTVQQDSGVGIRIAGAGHLLTRTNNIVAINAGVAYQLELAPTASLVSNFNLAHLATGAALHGMVEGVTQATLGAWQTATGRDAQSRSAQPLFVDMDGPDNILGYDGTTQRHGGADDLFLLRAGSPAIDAGESLDARSVDAEGLGRLDDPGTANAGSLAYLVSSPPSGSVFDAPLGGTALGLRGNNLVQQVNLPFAFPFFGTLHTHVWVSENGLLQFTPTNAFAMPPTTRPAR